MEVGNIRSIHHRYCRIVWSEQNKNSVRGVKQQLINGYRKNARRWTVCWWRRVCWREHSEYSPLISQDHNQFCLILTKTRALYTNIEKRTLVNRGRKVHRKTIRNGQTSLSCSIVLRNCFSCMIRSHWPPAAHSSRIHPRFSSFLLATVITSHLWPRLPSVNARSVDIFLIHANYYNIRVAIDSQETTREATENISTGDY